MSKKFFGLINTPKTATNDDKHFFNAENNTPVFNVPSATIFSFQGSSDDTLAGSKSSLDDLKNTSVEKNCSSRRNSVSDSEQLDDYYSSPPLKLADPHEHRVKRRHHSGGSHASDVSPRTLHPLSSSSSAQLASSFHSTNNHSENSSSLLIKCEALQKPSPGSSSIYDSPCIGNHCSASLSNEVDQNVSCDASAGSYNERGAYPVGKIDKVPSLFDENDDEVASVDFDNCMENDVIGGIDRNVANNIPARKKTRGRVKINIELIQDKERRSTTFSKRKNGILKKANELAILTGAEVMLLIASETGHVYSYATDRLKPIIQGSEGEQLVLSCLKQPQENSRGGSSVGSKSIKLEVVPPEKPMTITLDSATMVKPGYNNASASVQLSKPGKKRRIEDNRARNEHAKAANLVNGHVHSSPQSQSMQSSQSVNERIDGGSGYLTEMVQTGSLPPSSSDMLHSSGVQTATLTVNPTVRLMNHNNALSVDRNPATNSGSACLQYTTYPQNSSAVSATSVTQLSVPVPASLITVPASVPLLLRQSDGSNSNNIRQTSSPRIIQDSSNTVSNSNLEKLNQPPQNFVTGSILQNVHVQSSVSLPLQMGQNNTKYFVSSSQPPASSALPISITSNPNFINIQQMPFQASGNSPNHACTDITPSSLPSRIKIEEAPPQMSQQQLETQQQMMSYQASCANDIERGVSLRQVQIAQFPVIESVNPNMHGTDSSNSVAVITNMPHVHHRATPQLIHPPPRVRSVTPVNESDSSLASNR